jgi:hypothetical protein
MAFLISRSVIRYNLATRKLLALHGYTVNGGHITAHHQLTAPTVDLSVLTHIKNYSTDRNLSTSTTAAPESLNYTNAKDAGPNSPQRDPLDVGFNDPLAAFKSKTTFELIRAYFVYLLCSSEYLVENNMKVGFGGGVIAIVDEISLVTSHTQKIDFCQPIEKRFTKYTDTRGECERRSATLMSFCVSMT